MKLSVTLPWRLGNIEVNFQPELNALFWFFSILAPVGTINWYYQGIFLGLVLALRHTDRHTWDAGELRKSKSHRSDLNRRPLDYESVRRVEPSPIAYER